MPPELIERTKKFFLILSIVLVMAMGLQNQELLLLLIGVRILKLNLLHLVNQCQALKVELRDEEGQLITADSYEGEIYVQSPSVMLGYLQ